MPSLRQLALFSGKLLQQGKYVDGSKNGLQVNASSLKQEIKTVGFAVDACMTSFQKAAQHKCQLLITHHGLFWKGQRDVNKINKQRVAYLKKHKVSLYAQHLPLDAHEYLGNNIQLAHMFGLKNITSFGEYLDQKIGYFGDRKVHRNSLVREADRKLRTKTILLPFGPKKSRRIGIVSGSGVFAVKEAPKYKIDTVLTGTASHSMYHYCKELKLNVLFSGHYATEKHGLLALAKVLRQKFNIRTIFFESPTGL